MTTNSLLNMGNALSEQGELEEALEYFLKCIKIQEQHYGPEHIYLARTHHFIGQAHMERGELDKAVNSFQESLRLVKKQYGDRYFRSAFPLKGLGIIYGMDTYKDSQSKQQRQE